MVDVSDGRLRPLDMIGRAHIARPSGSGFGEAVVGFLAATLRLVVPVLLLLSLGAAIFVYGDVQAPMLSAMSEGHWLTLGLVLLPLTLFAVQLTNRRYGAGYAFGQVVLAWGVALATLPFTQGDLATLRENVTPAMRDVAAFGGALFLAQIVSIVFFDRLRGPRWWKAPLFSTLFGGLVLSLVAFPAAFAGTPVAWSSHMAFYLGFMVAAAIALLIPYWILRPVVPPLSGFGGY
ncbi:MAG: VUT family protein [Proteobacteria bacterium]|nr:VUT family protein [Pseudomonadota bacterium]